MRVEKKGGGQIEFLSDLYPLYKQIQYSNQLYIREVFVTHMYYIHTM